MAKLNETQQRFLSRLQKVLADHKAKPTAATKELVTVSYEKLLRQTLSAEHLTKDEVETLKSVIHDGSE